MERKPRLAPAGDAQHTHEAHDRRRHRRLVGEQLGRPPGKWMTMRLPSKYTFGIVLLALSVLTLTVALCQSFFVEGGNVDFPCFAEPIRRPDVHSDTRIVYCISFWPRGFMGGAIYGMGVAEKDEVTVGELNLRRDEQVLYVNNHPLGIGEVYDTIRWTHSANPWRLYTTRIMVRNEGLLSTESFPTADVLSVSGDVREGRYPSPLGFLILGAGIWLYRQGKRERKGVVQPQDSSQS